MKELNDRRVVLMAHSMGNKTVQYFLQFLKNSNTFGQRWIDTNIHAFYALGPPFLGAPKTIRTAVTGDSLEVLGLTFSDGKAMARCMGSFPWLFPLNETSLPDSVARLRTEDITTNEIKESYEEYDVEKLIKLAAPSLWQFYLNFYEKNPYYLLKSENAFLPPVLEPPPVETLWVLYGKYLHYYYYK